MHLYQLSVRQVDGLANKCLVSFATHSDSMAAQRRNNHCTDVTWASWRLKSSAIQLTIQQLVNANQKTHIWAFHGWPFVRVIYPWLMYFPDTETVIWKTFVVILGCPNVQYDHTISLTRQAEQWFDILRVQPCILNLCSEEVIISLDQANWLRAKTVS